MARGAAPPPADAGDERGVGDQPVHRAEDRRPQPAAGHVGVAVVVRLGLRQRLGAAHASSASAPSGTVGSSGGVGRATRGDADASSAAASWPQAPSMSWPRVSRTVVATPAARSRATNSRWAGQRAGVPLAARRRVERDQVHVRELPGQQLAEQVGAERLVVDVADQRVLDRVPAAGLPRVGVGGVDDLADLPAGVDRHEGVAQLVVRGVQAHGEGDVAALLGEPADRRDQADRRDGHRPLGQPEPVRGRGRAGRRGSCGRGRSWPAAPPCP